jgi:hypothetical protein
VPQIDDRTQPFRSRIRATLPRWTEALEAMAVETSARGLSTRDTEALFAHATDTSLLSRSAVSQIRERLWAEYERRQLRAIHDALDSDVAARTTPATAATVTASPTRSSSKHPDLTLRRTALSLNPNCPDGLRVATSTSTESSQATRVRRGCARL